MHWHDKTYKTKLMTRILPPVEAAKHLMMTTTFTSGQIMTVQSPTAKTGMTLVHSSMNIDY